MPKKHETKCVRKRERGLQMPATETQATAATTTCSIEQHEEGESGRRGARTRPRQQDQELDQEFERYASPYSKGESSTSAGSHSFRHITIGGSSRNVLGDIHAEKVVFNSYRTSSPHWQTNPEDMMKALAFDVMGSRKATIAPAHARTCLWVLEKPEYIRWNETRYRRLHHVILWIKGHPGVGKSTLMKCISEVAEQQSPQNETTVSLFFNAQGFAIERSTEGMYRSLLYQILKALPRLQTSISDKVTIIGSRSRASATFVELLLSHGADVHYQDTRGRTAYDVAKVRGDGNIIQLIIKALRSHKTRNTTHSKDS